MSRYVVVLAGLSLAACAADADEIEVEQAASLAFSREHVTADIYHYEAVLPVGSGPNAAIRIHRVEIGRAHV